MLKFTKQPKTLGITLKNLLVSFYNTLCAHKSQVCIILQIGAIEKKCWFSAAYYRIWLEGYQIIFVRSSSLAKGQQTFKIKPVNIQSRSSRTLIKRTPEKENRSSYFYSYKPWKSNYGSYLNWHKYFFHFELLAS